MLQSRAVRGCLQSGRAHWSFQAQQVAAARPAAARHFDRVLQEVEARAHDATQQHTAAAAAVAALNVSAPLAAAGAARRD